jgi:putative ABC transport system permease protein
VKNFHYESLHNPVGPFILFPEWRGRELLVKVSGQRLTQTLSALESKWKSLVTDRPFEYHFLDEDYNKLYNAEIRLGKLMNIFAAVAIILACLGLYGLSAYAAQQRIKEIGIRKVLGASIQRIVFILSKNFLWLAAMSMLIAFPLAWWASAKWLADFSYRTALSWDIFAVAGLLTLFLAMATVSFHAFKAAWTNPVKNLRTE